jgi:hypothetical protein
MNLNYVVRIKHDLDKLLNGSFIIVVEEVNWLSLIIVVRKQNG